jgi:hypothetical protein
MKAHIVPLGPVQMFECSFCKQRHSGPPDDEATKTWMRNHRTMHVEFEDRETRT